MIEPASYKLKIRKGATFRKSIFVEDEAGQPFNLSGYSVVVVIQRSATDATVLLTMNAGNGRVTLGPDTGQIQLFISNTDTAGLSWASAFYTLKTTAPSTDVDLIMHGGVSVIS